jgi:chromate transporter
MPADDTAPIASRRAELWALTRLFLRLGLTAFGGPAAHVAIMEDEVVTRRKWLTRQEFLDLLGATNLIPGPNSTEMAIHIGHRRAGFPGLAVAGTCFILPAAVMVGIIASAYVRFGTLPQIMGVLYAVKPVVLVIVLQALWRLSRAALKDRLLAIVAVLATACSFLQVNELLVLLGAGIAVPLVRDTARHGPRQVAPAFLLGLGPTTSLSTTAVVAGAAIPFGLWPLLLFFLKVGAVLFGSGYVLLAFLRADLVERWHWLTEAQLLDAIAVGQVTPGPLFTTATFIGYVLGGLPGAVLATVGIFLPAFFFVAISGPIVPRLRKSVVAGHVLDGVNAGSLALMVVVTWYLGRAAVCDVTTIVIAIAGAIVLWRIKLNSVWLILAAGLAGLVIAQFR